MITANTTVGPEEIRCLRLKDIDVAAQTITVREGAKNKYRERTVELNDDALWAVSELLKRAAKMGALDAEHYFLPHRAPAEGGKPDPTRPVNSWYGGWYALRKAAGLPTLRRYDLRHDAITRLLEDENVSERTVVEIAGHVSRKMLDRYSHVRSDNRREALDRLARKPTSTIPLTWSSSTAELLEYEKPKKAG
jgi:integrase